MEISINHVTPSAKCTSRMLQEDIRICGVVCSRLCSFNYSRVCCARRIGHVANMLNEMPLEACLDFTLRHICTHSSICNDHSGKCILNCRTGGRGESRRREMPGG
jgi:hypothetical protein